MTETIPCYVFYNYNIFLKINIDFYDSIDRDLEKTSRRLEHLVRLSQLRIDLVQSVDLIFYQLNGHNADSEYMQTITTNPIDTNPQFSYLQSLREEQEQTSEDNETNNQQYREEEEEVVNQKANSIQETDEDNLFEFSPNTQRRINALSRGDMSEYANVVKTMGNFNDEINYPPSNSIPMKISDPIAECGDNEVLKSSEEDKKYFTQSQKQKIKPRLSKQEMLYYETKNKINSLMRETV